MSRWWLHYLSSTTYTRSVTLTYAAFGAYCGLEMSRFSEGCIGHSMKSTYTGLARGFSLPSQYSSWRVACSRCETKNLTAPPLNSAGHKNFPKCTKDFHVLPTDWNSLEEHCTCSVAPDTNVLRRLQWGCTEWVRLYLECNRPWDWWPVLGPQWWDLRHA